MKRMIDKHRSFTELKMAISRLDNLKNDPDLPEHLKSTVEAIKINIEDAISDLPIILKAKGEK